MMTISELNALIGKTGVLTTLSERLNVRVTVRDARAVFGRTDVFVIADSPGDDPLGDYTGYGFPAWVTLDRLVIDR